jgi:hypothetical protein
MQLRFGLEMKLELFAIIVTEHDESCLMLALQTLTRNLESTFHALSRLVFLSVHVIHLIAVGFKTDPAEVASVDAKAPTVAAGIRCFNFALEFRVVCEMGDIWVPNSPNRQII